MDAFEKWADGQWFRGKGDDAPAPSMMLIAKSYEEEARKAFRAGMRCAADIAFSLAIKSDKVYTAGDVRASILANADK